MAVSFAVGLPNVREYADPRLLVELAVAAEAAGWDGVFVWDHIAREEDAAIPATDPWIALAAIAARTERVRLGAMVTPLSRRRPWKVARETVALDVLSGGRLTFGVGLGGGVAERVRGLRRGGRRARPGGPARRGARGPRGPLERRAVLATTASG